jgi:hypothetical protein
MTSRCGGGSRSGAEEAKTLILVGQSNQAYAEERVSLSEQPAIEYCPIPDFQERAMRLRHLIKATLDE